MRLVSSVAVLVLVSTCGLSAAEALIARVSQTVAPLFEAAKPAFAKSHPDVTISVTGCPSPTSIKMVASGEAGIGAIVRDLKPDEKTANPDLIATPFARDGVALVVNSANPVEALSKDQIIAILTGSVTTWKAVGGGDGDIAVVGRTEANAINEFLEQKFGLEHRAQGEGKESSLSFKLKGGADYTALKIPVTGSHKDALAQVVVKPNAWSYVPLGLALAAGKKGQPIKIVALDGVKPEPATINGGTYLLSRTLFLLTKGQPTGAAKDLCDFILAPEGQALAADNGFVLLK
jgi:phosphate transport system substrate-binding protein